MPMPFWKPRSKGKERAGSSSASDSGDSPTSTSSPQSQIPVPAGGCHTEQPSSSRRNDPGYSSNPGIGTSITSKTEEFDEAERPMQAMRPLDYQPSGHRGLPPPSTSSKRIYNMPGPAAQTNYDELYTRHALETFKFGSPSITTMTDTSSVDPLSSEEDFLPPAVDTTPRPSLAVHTEGIRSHPSQVTSPSDRSSLASHRPARSDATSIHTFGARSPASVSASSLVNSTGNGQIQSGQENSQEQSSDDEPRVRYYTSPYVESIYSSSLDSTFTREDFYNFDDEDFSDPDPEVSSAQYDDADSYDQSYFNPPPEQDSFRAAYLARRRGSSPIPIPGAQEGQPQGRDREDSVATVKLPMPSAPGPSTIGPISPTSVAPNPLSLPANGADWGQRRRAIQDKIDSPAVARSHPPIHGFDYASAALPNIAGTSAAGPSTSQPGINDLIVDFDPNEWKNLSLGIKDLHDVAAKPSGMADTSIGWWSRLGPNDARRPSIASTINDTFQKHALAFKDQDWSFRKDKADGSVQIKKKRNTFTPFNERPPKRGPPWRGMEIGQTEYWRNELTGLYKVERMEINASDNRPKQQRLSIHHIRDGTRQAQRPTPGIPYDPHNGPTTTVHKHSKAAAFSLSRHYRDKSQSKSGDRRNTSKVQPLRNAVYINGKKTAMILLAPRKVQEAYTSTTTTRKLESHGFLDDSHRARDMDRYKRLAEEDEKVREKLRMKEKVKREKELEKQKKAADEKAKREKGKGRIRGPESTLQGEAPAQTYVESGPSNPAINSTRPSTAPAPSSVPPAHIVQDAVSNVSLDQTIRTPVPTANLTAPAMEGPVISTASSVTVAVSEPTKPVQQQASTRDSRPSSTSNTDLPLPGVQAAYPPLSENAQPRPSLSQIQHSTSVGSDLTTTDSSTSYPVYRDQFDYGEEDEEIDEEDKQLGVVPRRRKRTPHNEAYHSLSPESIDSFAAQQENHSRGLFALISRNASSRTLHIDTPYNPPWLSAPSRPHNHDMQLQVVAGLNSSFQGVGLLPTDKELRESRRRKALKNQAHDAARTERKYTKEKDIFIDLPDEALYMLLPLWPSETDPVSAREHPFDMPSIQISERLYALVYYKPWYPPESSGKSKSKDKAKKSRGSPTSSQEGIYIDERNVLMSQFYIGARIVTYDDLEGSNVRVPELGLSVMGPLSDAYRNIPVNNRPPKEKNRSDRKGKLKDQGETKSFWDFIIGTYHSREHPMEFYPEGFKKMGLADQQSEEQEGTAVSSNDAGPSRSNVAEASGSGSIREVSSNNTSTSSLPSISSSDAGGSSVDINEITPFAEPGPSGNPIQYPTNSEEDPIEEPPIILTPIGRAVLEMAFMGALAVTGFAPQPYW